MTSYDAFTVDAFQILK